MEWTGVSMQEGEEVVGDKHGYKSGVKYAYLSLS